MELWGLTGLAGSGKSLALTLLKKHGTAVIDSDQVARDVVDPATPAGAATLREMVAAFGAEILDPETNSLKRRELRDRIAANPEDQKRLEALLHPRIVAAVLEWANLQGVAGHKFGIVEGTRLIESGFSKGLRGIILLTAPAAVRLDRLEKRDGLSRAEAEKLLGLQNERSMKNASAICWTNASTPEELEKQILGFLQHHSEKGSLS